MTTNSTGWKSAFSAFLDRRALIMLFLGFSAGIPILLIFSSLSLWLGEAGIEKSAVTFFSWAALGYSFKFVWAPLIDELPVPFLTKKLGRRRAWLLIAQVLIICAIMIMAFSNPALGQNYLYQMAIGAVLLGFSAATQDIVIDAYRIELAETQMQTVLASTYNAGYRIGMIVAGAGALFLAAYLGTAKGNYIYEAWKYTYLAMAAVMLIGIVTTLSIREPQVNRINKNYQRSDYFRLIFVFFVAVISFILTYIFADTPISALKQYFSLTDSFLLFLIEAVRFLLSIAMAVVVGYVLVHFGAVNRQMAIETWINPIADFFKRYGLKLALALLLLIGFYRISDIISGVISNVFYQDLNFTKEQIAEAVKVYGVIFSLIGGFLGGLLAQKINIMKLMFVAAILASVTNLTFIGLVKSGDQLDDVEIQVAGQKFVAQTDEVGAWSAYIPTQLLQQGTPLQVQFSAQNQQKLSIDFPYIRDTNQEIKLLPLSYNNQLSSQNLNKNIVIQGQYLGELSPNQKIQIVLDEQKIEAKLETSGIFSANLDGRFLAQSPTKKLVAQLLDEQGNANIMAELPYQVSQAEPKLNIQIEPLPNLEGQQEVQIQGKVIKSYSTLWLYFAIIMDNLAAGLAGAAFIAFLSSLTSVSFTAVQYAIFSSLMTLTPKILGGYSGTIVSHIGYPNFFLMTTLIGIPILILVIWVAKLLNQHQKN